MASTARRLILENKMGESIRSFHVASSSSDLNLIYRLDTRRVELHADMSALDESEVQYKVLKTTSVESLSKRSMNIEGLGKLRIADENEKLSSVRHEMKKEDDDQQLTVILKKTSMGHAAAVALLMVGSLIAGYFADKQEEPQLVTIQMPKKEVVQPKQEHVKVSEKKIVQQKVPPQVKVADKTNLKPKPKVVPHKVVKTIPQPNKHQFAVKNAPQKNMERVGALAVLGGLKNGARNAEGLDLNSMKNIRSAGTGNGGGGVGDAGKGGMRGMMPGSGLIAGSAGSGGRAESAGGYGTKGSGGGKAGYGKIAIVGGTSGVSLPLDEEATIAGGLDQDQIKAVVNKNIGQIIYCYEQGLQRDAGLRGRVSVQFVIAGNGRISVANVSQSSLRSKQVEGCMVAKMKSWQFPKPVGRVNVDVLYPFELRRVSSR